jgi:hypothetical protein
MEVILPLNISWIRKMPNECFPIKTTTLGHWTNFSLITRNVEIMANEYRNDENLTALVPPADFPNQEVSVKASAMDNRIVRNIQSNDFFIVSILSMKYTLFTRKYTPRK